MCVWGGVASLAYATPGTLNEVLSSSSLCCETLYQGLRDTAVGAWIAESALGRGAKTRSVTYIRPLSIPIPMAPKQCNVTEVHSVGLSWARMGRRNGAVTAPQAE